MSPPSRRRPARRCRSSSAIPSQFAAAIRATGGKPDMDVVYIDNSLAAQTHGEKLQRADRPDEADARRRRHSDGLGQG